MTQIIKCVLHAALRFTYSENHVHISAALLSLLQVLSVSMLEDEVSTGKTAQAPEEPASDRVFYGEIGDGNRQNLKIGNVPHCHMYFVLKL